MSELVLPLELSLDVSLAGGKGASLARLLDARFNVPPGFVITTASKSLDKQLEAEILAAFDKLGAKYVAVRSSAAAEDGAKDAWAGQLDTFLNVTRDKLLEKIKLCLDSNESERAKSYAEQKQINSGAVAVIVQKMVPSEISGVAFSAHPVTNSLDQVVIEAVTGLGEDLVSGRVTPDTYVANKRSGEVIEKHLASSQVLNQTQIKTICEEVRLIEKSFGFPVDVEWTLSEDKLFILQSRPITTLG